MIPRNLLLSSRLQCKSQGGLSRSSYTKRTSESYNVEGSYYRILRERLLLKSDGNGPLKLLYPKSKTSRSFSSPISFGIYPDNKLFRKILWKLSTSIQFRKKHIREKATVSSVGKFYMLT